MLTVRLFARARQLPWWPATLTSWRSCNSQLSEQAWMFAGRISARSLLFVTTQQSRRGHPPMGLDAHPPREVGPFGGLSTTCLGACPGRRSKT